MSKVLEIFNLVATKLEGFASKVNEETTSVKSRLFVKMKTRRMLQSGIPVCDLSIQSKCLCHMVF